jgi:hypothetical protein
MFCARLESAGTKELFSSRLPCSAQGWRVQVQKNCAVLDYHVLRKVGECRYRRTFLFWTAMFWVRLENTGTKELFYSRLLCSSQEWRVQVQKELFCSSLPCSAQGWRVQVQTNCSVLDYHVLRKVGESAGTKELFCSRLPCSALGWRVQVQQNCFVLESRLPRSAQGWRVQVQKIFSVLDCLVLHKVEECRYRWTVLFYTVMFCARLESAGTTELFCFRLSCSAQGLRVQVQKNCSVLDCHVLGKVGECRYKRTVLF